LIIPFQKILSSALMLPGNNVIKLTGEVKKLPQFLAY